MKNLSGSILLSFVLFTSPAFAAEETPAENHIAVNVWGFSHHAQRNKGYNEQNWGLGVRAYHGNWFAAADEMRNSVRGNTFAYGIGYEYPLFTLKGFTASAVAEAVRVNYEFPGLGIARATVILPGASVRKENVSANLLYIPETSHRKSIVMLFGTYHFKGF